MKFNEDFMPLKVTLLSYFIILYLYAFQNGDVQTSEGDAKSAPVNMGL
jgi:hypothetical protein